MPKKKLTFEQSMLRLENIVSLLESGETDLEDSLKLFSEGAALLGDCRETLNEAEQIVEKLFPGNNGRGNENGEDND